MDLTDYEILTTKAASAAVGIPAPTMMKMAAEGTFPKPLELPGCRRLGWRTVEIMTWLDGLKHRTDFRSKAAKAAESAA